MAVWLAEQVGESGEVVATDIDVTYLKQLNLPNLEVRDYQLAEYLMTVPSNSKLAPDPQKETTCGCCWSHRRFA